MSRAAGAIFTSMPPSSIGAGPIGSRSSPATPRGSWPSTPSWWVLRRRARSATDGFFSRMSGNDTVPRTGSHWIRVVILALIPILIVAGAGTYLLTRHTKPDTRQVDSQAALRAYTNAWAKADYPA